MRFATVVSLMFVLSMLSGCAKQLTASLQGRVFPMGYLYDSPISTDKSPVTVRLSNFTKNSDLPEELKARLTFFFALPAAIVNFAVSNYTCELGKASIQSDPDTFLRKSIIEEARRSGCFTVMDSAQADYDLDIHVIKQRVKGPYSKYFYLFFLMYFYGFGYGQTAGEAESDVSMEIVLKKDANVQFQKVVDAKITTKAITARNNLDELRQNYVNSLVEAFSNSYKECAKQAIQSVNAYLKCKTGNEPIREEQKEQPPPVKLQNVYRTDNGQLEFVGDSLIIDQNGTRYDLKRSDIRKVRCSYFFVGNGRLKITTDNSSITVVLDTVKQLNCDIVSNRIQKWLKNDQQ
jgi:hypothetical protein